MNWKLLVIALVVAFNVSVLVAQDVEYTIFNDTEQENSEQDSSDEKSAAWFPLLSIEAFGYDIREMWRFPKEDVYSYSVGISEELDLLCDIRPHEWPKPEVWTFGGYAFSR